MTTLETTAHVRLNGKLIDLPGAVVTVRDLVRASGRDHRTHWLVEKIGINGRARWLNHQNRAAVLDCRREAGRERVFETRTTE